MAAVSPTMLAVLIIGVGALVLGILIGEWIRLFWLHFHEIVHTLHLSLYSMDICTKVTDIQSTQTSGQFK